jgi:hypothetical protein
MLEICGDETVHPFVESTTITTTVLAGLRFEDLKKADATLPTEIWLLITDEMSPSTLYSFYVAFGPDILNYIRDTCRDSSLYDSPQDKLAIFGLDPLGGAAKEGHLNLVNWFRFVLDFNFMEERSAKCAVKGGNINILKLALEGKPPERDEKATEMFLAAVKKSQLEILKFLRLYDLEYGPGWSNFVEIFQKAFLVGNLRILRYLVSNAPKFEGTINLQILSSTDEAVYWINNLIINNSKNRHIHINNNNNNHNNNNREANENINTPQEYFNHFNYAIRPDYEIFYLQAAKKGRLELMKWIRKVFPRATSKFHPVYMAAFCNRQVHVVEWLKSINPSYVFGVEKESPPDDYSKPCSLAARCGDLELIQMLLTQGVGFVVDETTAEEAASGGHLNVLTWLIENNHPHNLLKLCREVCLWLDTSTFEGYGTGHLGTSLTVSRRKRNTMWRIKKMGLMQSRRRKIRETQFWNIMKYLTTRQEIENM